MFIKVSNGYYNIHLDRLDFIEIEQDTFNNALFICTIKYIDNNAFNIGVNKSEKDLIETKISNLRENE